MKLSTRSRYGTRLMLELAKKYDDGPVLLKEISKNQDVSLKYLGQLIIPLKAAGLVGSNRGAKGGYYLLSAPSDVKIKDIVTAVEGPLYIVDCVGNKKLCNKSNNCITRRIWKELSDKFKTYLSSITLKDLVDMANGQKDVNKIIKKGAEF